MNRKIIAGVGILVIAIITGVVFLVFRKSPSQNALPPGENFSEIGNLAFNSPGLNADTWYLIYEKPGMPAIADILKFDSQSVCLGGPCPGSIQIGERVRVQGVATTSIVLVRNISADLSEGRNQESVALYFYNPLNDVEPGTRNIMCSSAGLVPADRNIPQTSTPIQDAVKLLLSGNITPAERAEGLTTWFPLPGVSLTGASLQNGVLTLSFDDPQNQTSGGACRVSVMWKQIEATAKQFPGVNQVKFSPATLFQP